MQRELYEVEKDRFDLKDSSLYHLQGTWPKDHKPFLTGKNFRLPSVPRSVSAPWSALKIWIW